MKTITLKRTLPALVLTLLLGVSIQSSSARDRWRQDPVAGESFAPRTVADRRVTLAQAIESVQRATGGKVLDAKDAGNGYRIKVLTRDGQVRVVFVDAQTGAMR